MNKGGYVYIMSNKHRNVLYVGVSSNLDSRSMQHKQGIGSVFTSKYNCHDLVYFEVFDDVENAIHREKRLKKYSRAKKFELIRSFNPDMHDLTDEVEGFQ